MSYIGSKPADAVLETDDIADGVVTVSYTHLTLPTKA